MLKLLSNFSGGGISTALYGVIGSLVAALAFVGWLYKGSLETIASLNAQLQLERENAWTLESAIEKQNKAFKSLEVKATIKDTSAVDRIVIKDKTCEAELLGYKEVFKELGK
ncbi:hypothetical protein LS70_003900 [Helicobacter sp. MIT 11-5569]|uniref:hypothetical protein n=1 Tax=Helicobacter sp. MIT 11-5569 TaxID=1548151 RepID=UPI00051FAB54|nr:hypothetical protein [Helicobacter sp. MIT 11-5569]TLD83961.1 hypothetical protein LS70_003900 [Helicobacter sp. MIT 11-5569]